MKLLRKAREMKQELAEAKMAQESPEPSSRRELCAVSTVRHEPRYLPPGAATFGANISNTLGDRSR
jgi:hypothetical protein